MTRRYRALVLGGALALTSGVGTAKAQDSPPPPNDKYVTRAEYEKLQTKLDTVLHEVAEMKKEKQAAPSAADTQAAFDEIDAEMRKVQALAAANSSGLDHFLITGDAGATFIATRGSPSTFGAGEAGFSPLFLWEYNDKLLVQVGMDFSVGNDPSIAGGNDGTNGTSNFDVSIADISYVINDYLTVDAGLFVTPFGQYHPHFDPRWINPLPDDPLAFGDDALGPNSQTGVLLQGAAPVSYNAKVNYAVYATNGPTLVTSGDPVLNKPLGTTPGAPGTGALDFSNNIDANNDKAVGGRIGFLPIPGMEFGYSAQYGRVNPANSGFSFPNVAAFLQAVDFNYSHEVAPLGGFMTFRTEWIFSAIESSRYGQANQVASGNTFSLAPFSNNHNGGYAQVTYRPTGSNNKLIKNTEFIFRYDFVQVPGPPGSGWIQRYEPGIDYWLNSSTVIKLAYEVYDSHSPSTTNTDALMASLDIGF